jgi:predicted Zn-dependent protease
LAAVPDSTEIFAALACARARAGDRAEAHRQLQQLLAWAMDRYVAATLVAQVQLALGERERAMEWLHRALQERAADLVWVGLKPLFASLHEDSELQGLLRILGLPAGETAPPAPT